MRLDPAELLAGWEALALPDPPCQLRLPPRAGTRRMLADRDRESRAAMTRLAGRGLSDGVRPVGELAAVLRTFGLRDHLLDVRCTGPVLGLGAVRSDAGVLAVSADGAGPVELRSLPAAAVPEALLALLGPVRARPSPPVNLPATVFDAALAAAGTDPWALADELVSRGVAHTDAHTLARVGSDVVSGGQLGLTAGHGPSARRGPWVVGFVRDAEGRYVVQLRRGGTVTVAPADTARLLRHWRELLDHTAAKAA